MWEWLLNTVSPIGALREQLSLRAAQLVEAHSLIANQTQRISELEIAVQNLEAERDALAKDRDALAERLKRLQSDSFMKPLGYNDKGVV